MSLKQLNRAHMNAMIIVYQILRHLVLVFDIRETHLGSLDNSKAINRV